MREKIKVEVFGKSIDEDIRSESGFSVKSTGQMYNEFCKLIDTSDVNRMVHIEYINIEDEMIKKYTAVVKMLSAGYKLPYVQVNGEMVSCGEIPQQMICDIVRTKYSDQSIRKAM